MPKFLVFKAIDAPMVTKAMIAANIIFVIAIIIDFSVSYKRASGYYKYCGLLKA